MKKIEKICMLIAGVILVPTVILVAFILIADVSDLDYSNFLAKTAEENTEDTDTAEAGESGEEAALSETTAAIDETAAVDEAAGIVPEGTGASMDNPESVPASEKESGGKINQEKYERIENGMSYQEVADIIGEEGNKTAESETLGSTTVMYEWQGEDGFGTAIIVLQDNRVINKSQTGGSSESVTTVPVTLSQYNQIEEGMTYEKVVEIFGGEGEVVSEGSLADAASAVYIWKGGDGISNATITFYNNAVFSKAETGLQ